MYRQDRIKDVGGGVAMIYPNSIGTKISPIEIDYNTCEGFNILGFDHKQLYPGRAC